MNGRTGGLSWSGYKSQREIESSIKGDVKGHFFPTTGVGDLVSTSSPGPPASAVRAAFLRERFIFFGYFVVRSSEAFQAADWRVRQPWFYRRLQAYSFFWLCEGA
jgi:hypothetical protein